jgi:putative DNA primase/helicase
LYALTSPVPLSDGDSAKHLSEQIAKLASASEPPRMIIIDTLARNFGSGDENSNTDVNRLIAKLDEHLRIPFNASVVIVHHSGNSDKDRARGASALKGAMDHEYRVEGRGDRRVLQCTKMKDGSEDFEFHFKIDGVSLGDGTTAGALVPLDVPSKKTDTRLTAGSMKALGALREIIEISGVPPNAELHKAVGMFGPGLVIHKDKWKQAAIDTGISNGTSDAQRRAFDRAIKQLTGENLVGNHGEYYWVKT